MRHASWSRRTASTPLAGILPLRHIGRACLGASFAVSLVGVVAFFRFVARFATLPP